MPPCYFNLPPILNYHYTTINHNNATTTPTSLATDGGGDHATHRSRQVSAVTAVGSVTAALSSANKAMDAKKMSRTMAEFMRQNEVAKVKEEMLDNALGDAFDESDVKEEADNVTDQVLAELGIEMDSKMAGLNAPSKMPPGKVAAAATTEEEEALMDALPDLKARLDAL